MFSMEMSVGFWQVCVCALRGFASVGFSRAVLFALQIMGTEWMTPEW